MPEPILSAAVKEQCSHVFTISVTKLFHDRGQDSFLVGGPLASSAREPVETLDVDTGTFTDERSLARFTQNDGKLFVTDLEGPHSLTVDGDVVVKNIPVELAPGQVLDFSGAQGDLVYEVYRDVIAHA